ncbi:MULTISPECIES: transglutaminase family protein [Caulobacter]|jgi:YD repeat-containing protein|uniref:YD repeat-containing protein n=1 Tax=Caulobacter rhizosphaerae TaxID=2010972 RepID=A0ABU1N140_9CAUL|nr:MULTISPECIES: transglutaminase family protein [Caulobacter]KQZ18233.1 transglutaminase [Caulobacter sp. Root1472]MDR6531676.1 YD repeat-containing protein [Caulobacter rhizosphaerae]
MARLGILHETRYSYARPVGFGAHRLLIRPRDSHAIRISEASLQTSLPGETRWTYDAAGNCVCWFTPQGQADSLTIISRLVIDRFPAPLTSLHVDDPHTVSPIVYAREDRAVLNPFIVPATEDEDRVLLRWLRGQMERPDEPAVDFLLRMNRTIHDQFDYVPREEVGVQTPAETIAQGSGTCRDFAWLMVEALRRLGYAAVFATGYIHSPGATVRGAGATHAWCEVFLPDLGWTEFDPTNGLAESPDLIRVAATRTPGEARPVSGTIIGEPGEAHLSVRVEVRLLDALEAAA